MIFEFDKIYNVLAEDGQKLYSLKIKKECK